MFWGPLTSGFEGSERSSKIASETKYSSGFASPSAKTELLPPIQHRRKNRVNFRARDHAIENQFEVDAPSTTRTKVPAVRGPRDGVLFLVDFETGFFLYLDCALWKDDPHLTHWRMEEVCHLELLTPVRAKEKAYQSHSLSYNSGNNKRRSVRSRALRRDVRQV